MNQQLYSELLDKLPWPESEDLEFKVASGGLPGSLWETYSAMANTQGGVILLGVDNDGTLVGVKRPNKLLKELWDLVNNPQKTNINLLKGRDVTIVELGNKELVAIRVPRASRHEKPVFVGQNPFRGTFRRSGEGDYLCSEQEIRRMISDQSQQPPDGRVLGDYGLGDLDMPSMQQFRNRLTSRQPEHPFLNGNDVELLQRLNGYGRCRHSGEEGVTVTQIATLTSSRG